VRYLHEYLGETIKRERLSQDLGVREFSEMASISASYLSEVERGLKNPSGQLLDSMSKGLGMNIRELLLRTLTTMEVHEKHRAFR
jgi:transcriptional regulator with XRE-family HTH domain